MTDVNTHYSAVGRVRVADAIDPPAPPPDEPLFRVRPANAAKARVELIEHLRSKSRAVMNFSLLARALKWVT